MSLARLTGRGRPQASQGTTGRPAVGGCPRCAALFLIHKPAKRHRTWAFSPACKIRPGPARTGLMQCRRRSGARGARHCCHAFTRLSVLALGPVLSPRLPATPSSNQAGSEKTNKKRVIGLLLLLMNVSSNSSSYALRPSITPRFLQAIQSCFPCPLVLSSFYSSP